MRKEGGEQKKKLEKKRERWGKTKKDGDIYRKEVRERRRKIEKEKGRWKTRRED